MNPAEFANIARAERTLWWYRGQERILFKLLDPFVGEHPIRLALEAGCGTGHMAKLVAQRYDCRVVGLDLGADGLRHGQRQGVARLVQGDIARLPFADGQFDVVLSLDVLVHFARGEEGGALAELARVLRPGGLLAVRVSALDSLRSRHSQFAHERQRFTRRRLLKAVRGHGLRPLRCTYANSLLSPVAWAKFRVWEPLLRRPPASGVEPVPRWLNELLYRPLAWEARLIERGWNLPLGQSLVVVATK